jgi:Na+-translocating ferredoxin:NAD+ oxidoreductase subunit A
MGELLWILVSALLVNNFVFFYFLGLCPFMGVTQRMATALRMGMATLFVMLITAVSAWFLNAFILPHAPYLRLISFIVVIASVVQIVEMVIKKVSPGLFRDLGIFLPLITTNCSILGLAIFQTLREYALVQSLFFAVGAGLGFTLALVLMASIRMELDLADVPSVVKGTALVFLVAGVLSLAFMGFAGMMTT